MNSKSTILANSALLCAALLTLAGCPSATESRFYLLTTLKESAPGKAVVKPLPGPALHVRVKLAKYLHRPEIVTRVGPNQYRLAEYDRWAEPLQENLSDILAENLSGLLPGRRRFSATGPQQRIVLPVLVVSLWVVLVVVHSPGLAPHARRVSHQTGHRDPVAQCHRLDVDAIRVSPFAVELVQRRAGPVQTRVTARDADLVQHDPADALRRGTWVSAGRCRRQRP